MIVANISLKRLITIMLLGVAFELKAFIIIVKFK